MRQVCSPKDKIWSQTDKLQRCRRLPLEQAKLRQILENNSESVLIRKWFDRWYVAESLCYKLRCKTFSFRNNMNPGADDQFFSVRISTISTRMDLSFARPLHVWWSRKSQPIPTTSTDSLPESLQFREDSSMPASTPRHLLRAVHLRQSRTRRLRTDAVK